MSDMLRMAVPITNKNIVQPMRENLSADRSSLDLSNVSKAVQANPESELLEQNNSNIDQSMTSEVLMEMLKDPNITVSFIKNIFTLQENIDLISKQDLPLPEKFSEEFEQLFDEMSVKPEELADELMNQQQISTSFKGELFDFLRQLSKESPAPGAKTAVINLLKSLNAEGSKPEILKTISGTLNYLSESLSFDKELSGKLYNLAEKFADPDAEKNFSGLKNEAEQLIRDIGKNTTDSKLSNLCSMIKYNLSRFSTNTSALDKAVNKLIRYIPKEENKTEFMQKFHDCLSGLENRNFNAHTKIFDALLKVIQNQPDDNGNSEKALNNVLTSQNPELTKDVEQIFNEFSAKSENAVNELINQQQDSADVENTLNNNETDTPNIKNEYAEASSESNEINSEKNVNQGEADTVKADANVNQGESRVIKGEVNPNQGESRVIKGEVNSNQGEANAVKADANANQGEADAVKADTNVNQGEAGAVKADANITQDESQEVKSKIYLNQNELHNDKSKLNETLRELLKENSSPELKNAVKNLLTAIDIENNKPEILKSLSNNMSRLTENLSQNKNLSEQLDNVSDKNLLKEASKEILNYIPGDEQKIDFMQKIYETFPGFENKDDNSKIFDALLKIFENQMGGKENFQTTGNSFDTLINSLLPSQNQSASEELKQAFNELEVKSENMANEFINSKQESTVFKGEFFDKLREILKDNESPELKKAVADLLKAVNIENSKPEILKNFSETLTNLSENLNKELNNLSDKSILNEAARNVMKFIPQDENKAQFLQKLYDFISGAEKTNNNSKVLDTIVKILQKQTDSESVMQMKGESVESVIHSLLSSPSNFTPLLHFILPIDDGILKAFGEMWINPEEEETKTNKDSKSSSEGYESVMHMLLVFEIQGTGRFETELWVKGKKISMSLLCPPAFKAKTNELSADLRKSISFSEYSFEDIKVGKLEKTRSLAEVFPALPQKRNGINVRI